MPILVDAQNRVIAGHGRLLACRSLGLDEVPTIRLDHLSEAQARAFLIADNRLTEIASWDDQLLGEQLKQLSELDLDFSLELTGFEMGQIELLVEGTKHEKADRDDNIPPPDPGPPVSRIGDLWLLGKHRILCGSALDEAAYRGLMDDTKAAMVITDPPYNVPIEGHVSGLGKVHHREFAMATGEMSKTEFGGFLERSCELLARYSVEGSLHFIFMDWRHMAALLAAGTKVYDELKNLCVWAKHNAGMGSLYRSQHELVFVFKHGRRGRHRNHVQLGRHGRNRTNVWNYPAANSFGRPGEEGNLPTLHPTVKPVAMLADALKTAPVAARESSTPSSAAAPPSSQPNAPGASATGSRSTRSTSIRRFDDGNPTQESSPAMPSPASPSMTCVREQGGSQCLNSTPATLSAIASRRITLASGKASPAIPADGPRDQGALRMRSSRR